MFCLQSLRLSHNALMQTTTGHIVNLMSNDVSRFDMVRIHYMCYHYLTYGNLQ